MASVNRVTLVGNLGKDPETRYMPNGDAVCSFSIATTDKWTDKASGEKREAAEWHNITCFRKLGEIASQYLKKGSAVYIEGKLKTDKYQKEGVDHYSTKIIADQMQMLGSKGGDTGNDQPRAEGRTEPADRNRAKAPAGSYDDMSDDIPFN